MRLSSRTAYPFFKNVSILAMLGLCCCGQSFSGCGRSGMLSSSSVSASPYCGFSCCSTRASVVAGHGLSCPVACGTILGQESNLCPLHWQVHSHHWTTREVQLIHLEPRLAFSALAHEREVNLYLVWMTIFWALFVTDPNDTQIILEVSVSSPVT